MTALGPNAQTVDITTLQVGGIVFALMPAAAMALDVLMSHIHIKTPSILFVVLTNEWKIHSINN